MCHFGLPLELTLDNGKQFDNSGFRGLCHQLGTKLYFASVYHPQSNCAVERANCIIFKGIKKNIIELSSSRWADELPKVIWSHNTTMSRATNFSPFKLLDDEEATHKEIKLGSWHTEASPSEVGRNMDVTLDTSEVLRDQAC